MGICTTGPGINKPEIMWYVTTCKQREMWGKKKSKILEGNELRGNKIGNIERYM